MECPHSPPKQGVQGTVISSPSRVLGRAPADHVLAHFELERVHSVTRYVLLLTILQKLDFMNPAQDGGNKPRKQENSTASRKVGISEKSVLYTHNYKAQIDRQQTSSILFIDHMLPRCEEVRQLKRWESSVLEQYCSYHQQPIFPSESSPRGKYVTTD